MRRSPTRPSRPYRVHLCESSTKLAAVHKIEASTNMQAREIAVQMLNDQPACFIAEVWDAAQLILTVRKE